MSTTMFCESCGATVEPNANFCVHCGSRQETTDYAETHQLVFSGGVQVTGAQGPTSLPASTLVASASSGSARSSSGGASTTPPRAPEPSSTAARAYTICAIREIADAPGDIEEGLFYPVGLEQRDTVALEPRDGSNVKRLKCTAIAIAPVGGKQTLLRAKEVSAQVLLTDARLTVACTKYDKGGGWSGWGVGGLALAMPLNAASHALAARRRRGKMLVGQVRYPWIHAVYAQSRVGFGGTEKLRVVASASGSTRLRIDLTFPKDIDACAVGTELVRRAAAFRLAYDDQAFADDERRRLRELTEAAPLKFVKGSGQMAGHQFPTSWPAAERSARFGLT